MYNTSMRGRQWVLQIPHQGRYRPNSGLSLVFGRRAYRDTPWVVTRDVFRKLQKQNSQVKFVKGA